MRFGLGHKIIMTNLIVLVITFIVVSAVVTEGVYLVNKNALIESLTKEAQVSVISIRQSLLTGQQGIGRGFEMRAEEFAGRLSVDTGNRILIYSRDKKLLADSEGTGYEINDPTELNEAFKGNRAYTQRNVDGSEYISFAFPVIISGENAGAVIFLSPLEQLNKNKSNIVTLLLVAFAIGIVVILIVSFLLSITITKPIKELKDSAMKLAGGHFGNKIRIKSSDEVGELAGAFNIMSDEIENRISIINIEKNKLNMVLESMGEGVVAYNENDEIIAINSTAKSILKGSDNEGFNNTIQKVKRVSERTIIETEVGGRYILVCATPLSLGAGGKGLVCILNDVTELRLLQEKQRQFVTNVSHELKTPLTTILGYVDLLKTRGDDKYILETSINYLSGASERLCRLVDDLIDLSCLSKFEFEIELRSVNLSALIRDIVGQMSLKAQKYDITVETDIPETGEILADPTRIKQAVVNIVDNAIKYAAHGRVSVTLCENPDDISLTVKDNGCGIHPDVLDKIFEPFYRVDKARSRELGGNGLGLAITKEIIEKHGGRIEIRSDIGEGTEVGIILPKNV